MASVEFAEAVLDDFNRIAAHLHKHEAENASSRLSVIVSAMDVLASNPCIGRPVEDGRRELIIGEGAHGYLALYAFVDVVDTVLVLALRSQREAAYTRS